MLPNNKSIIISHDKGYYILGTKLSIVDNILHYKGIPF